MVTVFIPAQNAGFFTSVLALTSELIDTPMTAGNAPYVCMRRSYWRPKSAAASGLRTAAPWKKIDSMT